MEKVRLPSLDFSSLTNGIILNGKTLRERSTHSPFPIGARHQGFGQNRSVLLENVFF